MKECTKCMEDAISEIRMHNKKGGADALASFNFKKICLHIIRNSPEAKKTNTNYGLPSQTFKPRKDLTQILTSQKKRSKKKPNINTMEEYNNNYCYYIVAGFVGEIFKF